MNWFLGGIFVSLTVRLLWTVLAFDRREAEDRYYSSMDAMPDEYWRGVVNGGG